MKHDVSYEKKTAYFEDGKIKIINLESKEIYQIKFKKPIISFHINENCYIIAQNSEKKFGIISLSGKVISPFAYKCIEDIGDKVIFWETDNVCFISDLINGKQSLHNYEDIGINGFGKYKIYDCKRNGKYDILNDKLICIAEKLDKFIYCFSNNFIGIKDKKIEIYSSDGSKINEIKEDGTLLDSVTFIYDRAIHHEAYVLSFIGGKKIVFDANSNCEILRDNFDWMKYWNSILGIIIAIKNNEIVIIDYINGTEKKNEY